MVLLQVSRKGGIKTKCRSRSSPHLLLSQTDIHVQEQGIYATRQTLLWLIVLPSESIHTRTHFFFPLLVFLYNGICLLLNNFFISEYYSLLNLT